MTGHDYNIVVLAYYPGVMLCELPSNMILSRVQPRYLFAVLVFGFGITVTLAGFAKNLASLVVCRFFIGAFEAGVLPGGLYLLSRALDTVRDIHVLNGHRCDIVWTSRSGTWVVAWSGWVLWVVVDLLRMLPLPIIQLSNNN